MTFPNWVCSVFVRGAPKCSAMQSHRSSRGVRARGGRRGVGSSPALIAWSFSRGAKRNAPGPAPTIRRSRSAVPFRTTPPRKADATQADLCRSPLPISLFPQVSSPNGGKDCTVEVDSSVQPILQTYTPRARRARGVFCYRQRYSCLVLLDAPGENALNVRNVHLEGRSEVGATAASRTEGIGFAAVFACHLRDRFLADNAEAICPRWGLGDAMERRRGSHS